MALQGHVKRDPATGNVALRTIFPDDDPGLSNMAWLVSTPNVGARHAKTSEVEDWEDLYIPEA